MQSGDDEEADAIPLHGDQEPREPREKADAIRNGPNSVPVELQSMKWGEEREEMARGQGQRRLEITRMRPAV